MSCIKLFQYSDKVLSGVEDRKTFLKFLNTVGKESTRFKKLEFNAFPCDYIYTHIHIVGKEDW